MGKYDKKEEVKEAVHKPTNAAEKQKALTSLISKIKKEQGEGSVFYGNQIDVSPMNIVPTGSMVLDITSGVGGLPRGRVVEVFGPEASGKSTLCLHVVAEAQKLGLTCGYIDMEHSLDTDYAKKLGIKIEDLVLSQPDFAEQALDIFKAMAESHAVDVIVLDSVAALVPKAELEGEMGDQSMGVQARMMSKMLRVVTPTISNNDVLAIFVNQLRMKIGVMYGNPETTTGGNALKYYASLRISVRRGTPFGGEPPIGHMMNVKFAKNKVAPPFTECEVPIVYGVGIDRPGDLFAVAKSWDILDVRGAHSYLDGEKLASSKEEMVTLLRTDAALYTKLEKLVRTEHERRRANPTAKAPEEKAAKTEKPAKEDKKK
jgi:recombination protein RecA